MGKWTIKLSRSLIETVWWNNCLHFGMRSREEHHSLKIEHFHQEIDENERLYIWNTEGLTKTRNKGLSFKLRLIFPYMYENKKQRCLLAFFSLLKTERPDESPNMGLYYLTVIDVSLTDVWYKDQVIGGQHNKRSVEQHEKSHHQ